MKTKMNEIIEIILPLIFHSADQATLPDHRGLIVAYHFDCCGWREGVEASKASKHHRSAAPRSKARGIRAFNNQPEHHVPHYLFRDGL
jgi:hypothetical protein